MKYRFSHVLFFSKFDLLRNKQKKFLVSIYFMFKDVYNSVKNGWPHNFDRCICYNDEKLINSTKINFIKLNT